MSRTIPKLYDSSISAASNEECEDYIVKKILKHPLLDDASALAKDNIELAPAGEIVSIIGPSGVGSTTLARSLKRYYAANWNVNADENLRPSMVHSCSRMPCMRVHSMPASMLRRLPTRWVPGVNALGRYGRWDFIEIGDPWNAENAIRVHLATRLGAAA